MRALRFEAPDKPSFQLSRKGIVSQNRNFSDQTNFRYSICKPLDPLDTVAHKRIRSPCFRTQTNCACLGQPFGTIFRFSNDVKKHTSISGLLPTIQLPIDYWAYIAALWWIRLVIQACDSQHPNRLPTRSSHFGTTLLRYTFVLHSFIIRGFKIYFLCFYLRLGNLLLPRFRSRFGFSFCQHSPA